MKLFKLSLLSLLILGATGCDQITQFMKKETVTQTQQIQIEPTQKDFLDFYQHIAKIEERLGVATIEFQNEVSTNKDNNFSPIIDKLSASLKTLSEDAKKIDAKFDSFVELKEQIISVIDVTSVTLKDVLEVSKNPNATIEEREKVSSKALQLAQQAYKVNENKNNLLIKYAPEIYEQQQKLIKETFGEHPPIEKLKVEENKK